MTSKSFRLALALPFALITLATAAYAAEAAPTSLDMSPLIALVGQFAAPLVGAGLTLIVGLVGHRFPLAAPFLNMAVAATHLNDNAKLETMIKHGLNDGMAAVTKSGSAIEVNNAFVAKAALWVMDQVPDTLDRLGITPEVLESRIAAIAASHVPASTPEAVPGTPVATSAEPIVGGGLPKGI